MTLDACTQLCRAAELSRENSKTICGPLAEEVHAVQGAAGQRQTGSTVDCMKKAKRSSRFTVRSETVWKREPFCCEMQSKTGIQRKETSTHCCRMPEYEDILCVSELETESVNKMDTSKEKDTT